MLLLTIIKKFWKELAFGVIIISLLGFLSYKNNKIDNLSKQTVQLTTELILTKEKLKISLIQISSQNDKIDAAAKESELKFQELKNIKVVIDKMDLDHKNEIKRLRNQKTPKTCDEVRDFLKQSVKDLKW